jgi:predicted nucleotidyltransferase
MPFPLSEPYATAVATAIAFLHERYQPLGIVVSGTIIRGAPHSTSDLDFVVIHDATWRQRV